MNPYYLQHNITRNDSGFRSRCHIGEENVTMTHSLAHLCHSFVQYRKKYFKIATAALFLVIY
jgi:hypothetical protein